MIDGSEKRNRQLAFELQNSHVCEKRSNVVCMSKLIGSFSNNKGDGNENFKNAIGLISKTTTLHVHHAFLYISLPSPHDYLISRIAVPKKFDIFGGKE